jgi:hypothetical protein
VVVKERRTARVGTVSGLALLAGATAVAAVAGSTHSIFATVLLGLLAAGMGHALLDEIRRQATRLTPGGWAAQDTVNTSLLAAWSVVALVASVMTGPAQLVRGVLVGLSVAYAFSGAYFATIRCRSLLAPAEVPATEESPTHTV